MTVAGHWFWNDGIAQSACRPTAGWKGQNRLRLARVCAAFTLLELVLVLSILAILLVAVAPALSGFAVGRRPGQAATEFLALTRLAHSNAIARGMTYRILIDPAHGRWWLANDESGTSPAEGEMGHVFLTPDGVQLSTNAPAVNGLPTLQFTPDGQITPAVVTFRGPKNAVQVACADSAAGYQIQSAGGPP